MRILILGGKGMLGHRLWLNLEREHEVWVTVRQAASPFLDYAERPDSKILTGIDALNFHQISNIIKQVEPDLLINCIGIIKQKESAKDYIKSISLNSLLPHQLSQICETSGIRMVHISTDCVFKGDRGNYIENDTADADDLYGKTKFLGEVASASNTITLRTSIIGQELFSRYGLIEWFLSNKDGDSVKGFQNAIFSGLTTEELSIVIKKYVIPNHNLSGLYHVSSDPINKYDLLNLVNVAFERNILIYPEDVYCINRSLDSSKFRDDTGYAPPNWHQMIATMAKNENLYRKIRNYSGFQM